MADQNLSISIRADASQLRADLALVQAQFGELGKQLRATAKEALVTGDTSGLKAVAAQYQAMSANVTRLSTEMKSLAATHNSLVTPIVSVGAAINDSTKSLFQNRVGMIEMQAAGVNAFQALAAGMSPLRVAMTEGAQVLGAFVQGGVRMGAVLTTLVTPLRAVAGLGAAAAVGVAVLGLRVQSEEDRLRRFGALLKGLGQGGTNGLPDVRRGGEGSQSAFADTLAGDAGTSRETLSGFRVTKEKLEEIVKSLREMGLSAEDAEKKVAAALRAGVPGSRVGEIIKTGRNLIPSLGEGADDKFIEAAGKGAAAMREFAVALGMVDKSGRSTFGTLSNGDNVAAALGRRVNGLDREALSPLSRNLRDTNVEFGKLQDSAAQFFKEGTVNAVDTAKAFGGMSKAIGETVTRGDMEGLWRGLVAATQAEFDLIKSLGRYISDTFAPAWTKATEGITKAWTSAFDGLTGNINAFLELLQSLIDKAGKVASAIGSALGGGAAATGASPGDNADITGMAIPHAMGGLIRGPGSGTSDSIHVRVSDGEHITNAASTAVAFPLLHAINTGPTMAQRIMEGFRSLQAPRFALGGLIDGLANIMPAGPAFASGGLVTAGAGASGAGGAVHLHFGNETIAIETDADIVKRVGRAARQAQMLSAGRKPGWVGG